LRTTTTSGAVCVAARRRRRHALIQDERERLAGVAEDEAIRQQAEKNAAGAPAMTAATRATAAKLLRGSTVMQ
jgi:hypothetical protein